jgi:hypothetical protein
VLYYVGMGLRARLLILTCGLMAAVALPAAQQVTKRETALVDQKMAALALRGEAIKSDKASKPVRTLITEREFNIYLQSSGKEQLPGGVRDAQITMAGAQRVSGRAIVDLDAVRTSKERGWLDPASYLTGSVEVKVTGLLQTANGKGTFLLESATIGGLPVPKGLVQELISYYSRTPETPEGVSLDVPFELPVKIREVQIQRGTATVIQ